MIAVAGFVFKDWYQQNKDDLNKSRRSRYKTDPEYREQVRKLNKESRARRRQLKEQEQRERKKHIRNPVPDNPWRTVDVVLSENDPAVRFFTIGALAQRLGCSVQVVRLWEASGVIPPTQFRDSRGRRLYTADGIENIVKLVRAQGRGRRADDGLLTSRIRPVEVTVRTPQGTTTVRMFRVGAMARVLRRSVLTLDQWDRDGHLPPTPFRLSSVGYRLYTVEMIRSVKSVLDALGGVLRGDEIKKQFHEQVKRAWTEQGVYRTTVVAPAEGNDRWQNKKTKSKKRSTKKPSS